MSRSATSAAARGAAEKLSGRAAARRRAMLDAGRELFLERGYAATTLADIVARSGGSLSTLYELFGNKRGLFEAILVDFTEQIMRPLGEAEVSANPERGLYAVGRGYLEAILEPKAVGWWRLVCSEAANVPDIAELLFSEAGTPLVRALARYLEAQAAAGRLRLDDPGRAARQFLELTRGELRQRALGGDARRPGAAEIDRQVRSAVDLFLYGCAAGRRPSPSSRRHP